MRDEQRSETDHSVSLLNTKVLGAEICRRLSRWPFLVAFALYIISVGCTPKPRDSIVGSWIRKVIDGRPARPAGIVARNARDRLDLRSDGTCTLVVGVGTDRISAFTTEGTYSFEGTKLLLFNTTDSKNAVAEFEYRDGELRLLDKRQFPLTFVRSTRKE